MPGSPERRREHDHGDAARRRAEREARMVTIAPSRRSGLARAGMLLALSLALAAIASCSSKSSSSTDNADASADGADASDVAPPSCGVPSSFAWNSTGVLLSPVSDATHNLTAIKDPSVVYFDNKWH